MRTNKAAPSRPARVTAGGGAASQTSALIDLRRAVVSCLLWERNAYTSGGETVARIANLVNACNPQDVEELAIEARVVFKLRHVPLLLARQLVANGENVAALLPLIIRRPDELCEFLALYWAHGRTPIANSVKRGLSCAMAQFSAFQLAKWDRDNKAIKLRDVAFLVHASPRLLRRIADNGRTWIELGGNTRGIGKVGVHKERGTYRDGRPFDYRRGMVDRHKGAPISRLIGDDKNNRLPTPNTWEVRLSAAGNNRDNWESLLQEEVIGANALLKNLRNMIQCGVQSQLIREALNKAPTDMVLPFQFITAARHAPTFEPEIESMMLRALGGSPRLDGLTVLVLDVSGSMRQPLASKSELTRLDAAAALGMLARDQCRQSIVFVTGGNDITCVHKTVGLPARRGFALADMIRHSVNQCGGGGIFLAQCLTHIKEAVKEPVRRLLVLTDEVDCDPVKAAATAPAFGQYNYILNVASEAHSIAFDKFTHVFGMSESVLDFIHANEALPNAGTQARN